MRAFWRRSKAWRPIPVALRSPETKIVCFLFEFEGLGQNLYFVLSSEVDLNSSSSSLPFMPEPQLNRLPKGATQLENQVLQIGLSREVNICCLRPTPVHYLEEGLDFNLTPREGVIAHGHGLASLVHMRYQAFHTPASSYGCHSLHLLVKRLASETGGYF